MSHHETSPSASAGNRPELHLSLEIGRQKRENERLKEKLDRCQKELSETEQKLVEVEEPLYQEIDTLDYAISVLEAQIGSLDFRPLVSAVDGLNARIWEVTDDFQRIMGYLKENIRERKIQAKLRKVLDQERKTRAALQQQLDQEREARATLQKQLDQEQQDRDKYEKHTRETLRNMTASLHHQAASVAAHQIDCEKVQDDVVRAAFDLKKRLERLEVSYDSDSDGDDDGDNHVGGGNEHQHRGQGEGYEVGDNENEDACEDDESKNGLAESEADAGASEADGEGEIDEINTDAIEKEPDIPKTATDTYIMHSGNQPAYPGPQSSNPSPGPKAVTGAGNVDVGPGISRSKAKKMQHERQHRANVPRPKDTPVIKKRVELKLRNAKSEDT